MDWQTTVERKLDRLLNDVEFVKGRLSTYLGRNQALTYLADETPIFVNTDDMGCPMNFISGGKYEEDYFTVFLSYRTSRCEMLDIGANLGVYSLRMAQYLRNGRINAFEPITRIRELFSRSVFLNGQDGVVTVHSCALSDHEGEAVLAIPAEHAGGASLELAQAVTTGERVELRMLDRLMPQGYRCDLVKLDVEGHEMHTLRGMEQVLRNSPNCVVMFEKLAHSSGIEADLVQFAAGLGWQVYGIEGTKVRQLSLDEFRGSGGYYVMGAGPRIEAGGTARNFFEVHPTDLNVLSGEFLEGVLSVHNEREPGAVLFHGPYWYLPRGYYRLTLDGEVDGEFELELCERFGFPVRRLELRAGSTRFEFPVDRDLLKFEFVLRARALGARLRMRHLRVERIG